MRRGAKTLPPIAIHKGYHSPKNEISANKLFDPRQTISMLKVTNCVWSVQKKRTRPKKRRNWKNIVSDYALSYLRCLYCISLPSFFVSIRTSSLNLTFCSNSCIVNRLPSLAHNIEEISFMMIATSDFGRPTFI